MPSPRLRVTLRCLTEDLALDKKYAAQDVRSYCEQHQALRRFVTMREGDPSGGEMIESCPPRGRFRSLHVGAGRGATLWDEDLDLVWLVGYHPFHQNGHPDDAYEVFARLHQKGLLQPTVDDILPLTEETPEELLESLRAAAPGLLEEARKKPGVEAVRTWNKEEDPGRAVLLVDMLVLDDGEAEQGWLGITFPRDVAWPDGGAFAIAAALLPPDVTPVPCDSVGPRALQSGEMAYTWDRYG